MKRYFLEIIETDEKRLQFKSECKGFYSFEVYGFLAFKLDDIRKQIAGEVRPDIVKREIHEPDAPQQEEEPDGK